MGVLLGLAVGVPVVFLGWALQRQLRGTEPPAPSLPPELAGRLRELEGLAAETRRVLEAHDLSGVLAVSAARLDELVAAARHLAEEQARLRVFLAATPRKAVEREVARRRARAGSPPGGVHAERLAVAESRLALVTRLEAVLGELRDRFGAIGEAVGLIHAQAVAASVSEPAALDLDRITTDLAAADAALAEVRSLTAQRAASPPVLDA